jgi:uncharacterized BrkB/YihY/UPF0761 family membrane protein
VDLGRPFRAFDRFQQSQGWIALPMAVLKKYADDQAGTLAALVAYYAFLSLFPLLLVFTTILGFVLQGNPGAQRAVEDSVLGQFPVIGEQIGAHALSGHAAALVVGLAASVFGGLGVTQAMHNAFDRIWAVPFKDRPDFLISRLRGLLLLLCLGLLFIVSTGLSGLITGLGGPLVKFGGIAVALLVNFTIFLAAFRFLTAATVPTRCLWIGVSFASAFWEMLQLVGGVYINHVYRHFSSTYAQFALVIALIVWLHLGAQVTVYAAEVNVVVARRLYPRSLFGPPEGPADEHTLRDLAKVEERHETEQVDVRFQP